ncbi:MULTISPECIES: hypothetical protein [unclassified Streptomyces]|uniref:hypothetical protein n=1 Tax=Streptomyces sp. NPDC008312 TaxID=3364825 RepID=UPI002E3816F6|nr:hypothetical protein [Streptomyces sp. NBC_01693]
MTAGAGRPAVLRRALRITLAALAGFYPLLYAAERPVAALYALFAPIAVGLLSAIPGSGRRQALVVLRVLPPALALAALGTALAVDTWAASGGMLAVGFLLAFAAVAGPRAAGAAPGLQLFYILACFPPYDPDSLGDRLTGLTVGILLLAATEILLPDPSVPAYRQRLADAVGTAARGASGAGVPPQTLREAGARMRLSRLPPSERPAGASRTDRALEQAGRAVRRLLDQLATLAELPPAADPASAALLGHIATVCDACAQSLRTGRPPPVPGALEEAMRGFQAERVRLTSEMSAPRPPRPVRRPAPTYCDGSHGCWPSPNRHGSWRSRSTSRPTADPPTSPPRTTSSGTRGSPSRGCGRGASSATRHCGRCSSRTPPGSRSASPPPGWSPAPSTWPTDSGCCSPC